MQQAFCRLFDYCNIACTQDTVKVAVSHTPFPSSAATLTTQYQNNHRPTYRRKHPQIALGDGHRGDHGQARQIYKEHQRRDHLRYSGHRWRARTGRVLGWVRAKTLFFDLDPTQGNVLYALRAGHLAVH